MGGQPTYRLDDGRRAACVSDRTSESSSGLHVPGRSDRSLTGPIRVRTSRTTGWPDGLAHPAHLPVPPFVDDEA